MLKRNSFLFGSGLIDLYKEEKEEEKNNKNSDEQSPEERREGLQSQEEFAGSLRFSWQNPRLIWTEQSLF